MSKQNTFIKTLVDKSVADSLDEASQEWYIVKLVEPHEEIKCICEKTNNIYYQLVNKLNKNEIYVGFDCLGKHCHHLKDTAACLNKQYHYKKTSKNPNKRLCHHCLKHNIGEFDESWRILCKSCYTSGVRNPPPISILGYKSCEKCFQMCIKPSDNRKCCLSCYKNVTVDLEQMRACVACHELKINIDEPSYKDKCSNCFRLHKEKLKDLPMRECSQCQELTVPADLPDYRDKCGKCYKLSLENVEYRECSLCHQMNIKSTEASFKTCCSSCYKNSKNSVKEIKSDEMNVKTNKNFNLLSSMIKNKTS